MADYKHVSPLLDGFSLGNPMSEHDGVRCCPAIKEYSDKKYIVKIISIPASQTQMDALLLAGAYKDAEGAMSYYQVLSEDVLKEAQFLSDLARLEGFLPYEGWQVEPIQKHRLGYEVFLVGTYKRSLERYVSRIQVTHLEAINLGLDMCAALSICREAGALYVDLKPSNIFISDKKEYRIGDLGFIPMDALNFSALPAKYRSRYTPPELHDPMASLNLTADTYAVGMILYQLYNEGRLPFRDHAPEEALPMPVNADYELAEIIMKAIHPDPQERWQDPKTLGQALAAYMQRNTVNDVPITPYSPIDPDSQNVRIPKAEPIEAEEDPVEAILAAAAPEAAAEAASETPTDPEPLPAAEDAAEVPLEQEQEQPEEAPAAEETAEEPEAPVIPSDPDMTRIFAKVDDLVAHKTPAGVVLPELPEEEDPFAFATEDSVEAQDLTIPIDPLMDPVEPEDTDKKKKKREKKFLSGKGKKRFKRLLSTLLSLMLLALLCCGGYWYYQNVYLQEIYGIQIEAGMDQLSVTVDSDVEDGLLTVTCSDNYGNAKTKAVTNGTAVFTGLNSNTMYKIQLQIDGFHELIGQTSDVFTTETTTHIVSFTAVTGTKDGSVQLNFTVDGEEPREWNVVYGTEGEKEQRETFLGHSVIIDDLSIGKVYTFTLDAGETLSLDGNVSVDYLAARLILAENLTATTTNGTDMTIRWTSPGDTVVEFWNVRCYNNFNGYEEQVSVTDTEVYLTGIDPSYSYTVEVTAAGMTEPARTSITANPLNITSLSVDDSELDSLGITWEFAGNAPQGGWLLMYSVDGSSNLNVIKCASPSASISPKIPGATYQLTIQSVDGTSIFGNVHSYSCPDAPGYDQDSIKAENISAHLLVTPEDPDWKFDRIPSEALTDQFTLGDKISIVLKSNVDFYLPGRALDILYVIRDAHGNVLPDYLCEAQGYWNKVWLGGSSRFGELDLPSAPDKAGSYVLSIYFNGDFIASAPFTISE